MFAGSTGNSELKHVNTIEADMPRTQRNDNFIDKASQSWQILFEDSACQKKSKEAFVYYRDGMSAQADGDYAEL